MKKTYEELLANAPPHDSSEFIDYLREHNRVIHEDPYFILIANCKYDTPEKRWFTLFWKPPEEHLKSMQFVVGLASNLSKYPDHQWLKKPSSEQTVKRFHMHISEQ